MMTMTTDDDEDTKWWGENEMKKKRKICVPKKPNERQFEFEKNEKREKEKMLLDLFLFSFFSVGCRSVRFGSTRSHITRPSRRATDPTAQRNGQWDGYVQSNEHMHDKSSLETIVYQFVICQCHSIWFERRRPHQVFVVIIVITITRIWNETSSEISNSLQKWTKCDGRLFRWVISKSELTKGNDDYQGNDDDKRRRQWRRQYFVNWHQQAIAEIVN